MSKGVAKREVKPKYEKYFLRDNPFPSEQSLQLKADKKEVYQEQLHEREIRRFLRVILSELEKSRPKPIWYLRDRSVLAKHNIAVCSGVFRELLQLESPRSYPVYVPLPLCREGLILRVRYFTYDRLQPERLKLIRNSFILSKLKKVQGEGQKVTGFDVGKLLQEAEENQEVLDEILTVRTVEVEVPVSPKEVEAEANKAAKENAKVSDTKEAFEERSDSEEKEKPKVKIEKRKVEDKRRAPLLAFLKEELKRSGFSQLTRNVIWMIVSEDIEIARLRLEAVSNAREDMSMFLDLLTLYYDKFVLIVGQSEVWEFLSETERARLLGEMLELMLLAKGRMLFIFDGHEAVREKMDPEFTERFQEYRPTLRYADASLSLFASPEKAKEVFIDFLFSDSFRQESREKLKRKELGALYPFTEKAIEKLLEKFDKDITIALVEAGKLLEKGAQEKFPLIDENFVERHYARG
jgi:hypothetical protein